MTSDIDKKELLYASWELAVPNCRRLSPTLEDTHLPLHAHRWAACTHHTQTLTPYHSHAHTLEKQIMKSSDAYICDACDDMLLWEKTGLTFKDKNGTFPRAMIAVSLCLV